MLFNRRITNIYFLCIAIISVVPQITPVTPYSTWVPLIFVLTVSAIKDAWEDIRRKKSDNIVNNRLYYVLRNGHYVKMKNQEISVGDIVKIRVDQEIPADMVVLKSSNAHGLVYADTANLDGETNLKTYKTKSETKNIRYKEVKRMNGTINAEVNHQNLYKFYGNIIDDGSYFPNETPLNEENLLLRGSRLRNTKYCVGVVVYAGKDTKIMINSNEVPSKFSATDRIINKVVVAVFVFKFLACVGCAISHALFEYEVADLSFYLLPTADERTPVFRGFLVFFSYFAIFSYFIPISLMVSLEIARLIQAMFMMWDIDCVSETGEGMSVKNSNLNDELARANYIFCDKTGTLTENKMEFDKCSVGFTPYSKIRNGELLRLILDPDSDEDEVERLKEYLTILAVCNTTMPELDEDGNIVYQSQSPDEICLCNFARDNGFVLKERRYNELILDILGDQVTFTILTTMEFTSERKKMSVILRTPDDKIFLYSKGADSPMLEGLSSSEDQDLIKETNIYLEKYSAEGLRTLLVCKRELTVEEFEDFHKQFTAASTLLEGRSEEIDRINSKMEIELSLVGCTAIEDKLQEGVPETIAYFLESGIKVWMITGDKQATAINIAMSCNLIAQDTEKVIINAYTKEEAKRQLDNALLMASNHDKVALVIDGASLPTVFSHYKLQFLEICKLCVSVVCCRATPLQKALIVRMMKKGTNAITLSIGDGANDVSMLMEAHIGVGIYGKEGSQAARSSDYAIHKFKDLQRLVCIHGRYNLIRSSGLIQYSFYKNLAMFLVQLWYAFFSGFSAQTLYDDIIMAVFNLVITSLPPLFLGIFERDIEESMILKYPKAHTQTMNGNEGFNYYNFMGWVLSALWHSLIIYFFTFGIFVGNDIIHGNGRTTGIWELGTLSASLGVVIVLMRAALQFQTWNWIIHFGIWASILAYIILFSVQAQFVGLLPNMWNVFQQLFSSGNFFLIVIGGLVAALLPDFITVYIRRNYFPKTHHILQELEKKKKAL